MALGTMAWLSFFLCVQLTVVYFATISQTIGVFFGCEALRQKFSFLRHIYLLHSWCTVHRPADKNLSIYTQKRADIVDIPSVYHLVISDAQGDISAQGDITFTL